MNNHIVLTILFLLPLSSFKTVTPLTNKDPITVKPMVSLYTATATAGTVSEGVGVIYDVEELVEASYAYPEKKVSSPFNKTLIAPSLLIDKRVNASSVGPQETFTYTIRYRCASLTEHCQDVQIEDIIPADMEIVSYTGIGGQISKVSLTGNTIVWDLQSPGSPPGQLDAGTTGLMSISVRFPCGSGAIAGTFTNTAEISASNSVVASSTADVTLSADAPTCPPTPVPTNDFIKKSVNSNVTENGVIFWDIITPGTGAAYTVEDYIDPATIVTLINRDFDSGAFLKLEIQCANSGNWYTVWEAGVGDNALNNISEIPAAAAECISIVHPYLSNIKIFNVTAVRYTIPSSTSSEQISDAVKTYAIDHNPFDGMTVTPPSSSAISALPNWEAPVPYAPINNCAVASDNSIGNNGMACGQVDLWEEGPMPRLDKEILGAPSIPFTNPTNWHQTLTLDPTANPPLVQEPNNIIYGLEVQTSVGSSFWEDPVIVDLLDPNLEYVPYPNGNNWWEVKVRDDSFNPPLEQMYDDPDCWNPTFSYEENWNGTGRTLLRWEFDGCRFPIKVGAGGVLYIYVSTTIKAGTPTGTEIGNMYKAILPENGVLLECDNGSEHDSNNYAYWEEEQDLLDLDNDGNTNEWVCMADPIDYTVSILADLTSSKWVQGNLDSQFGRYPLIGDTEMTGEGTFELYIKNTGNIEVTQLEVVDILPHIGDTDVLGVIGNRLSDWEMELVQNIVVERWNDATSTWDNVLTEIPSGIQYSTSTNPCRFINATTSLDDLIADNTAIGPTASGCTSSPWGATASGASSFGFQFIPNTPFAPGDQLKITINARIKGNPPGCSTSDCSGVGDVLDNGAIAWNSFAFGGEYDNGGSSARLLDSEPIKAGLRMIDLTNYTSLGNFVWHDLNADGVQDQLEPPIAGVSVRLYDATGTTLLQQKTTDSNGFYRFYGLDPSTTYIVRLENSADYGGGPLEGMALTIQDASVTNDTLDSDGSMVNGYPQITAMIGLVTGVEDSLDPTQHPTFDFGFFQSNKVGDFVWYDTDGLGGQTLGEPGVEGMRVSLFNVGPDGVSGGGDDYQVGNTYITLSDGLYSFNTIPNGTYYIQFDASAITGNDPVTGTTVVPADWAFTASYLTGDPTTDSDANSASGKTDIFTLNGYECIETIDAGLKSVPANPATIKGTIWNDCVKDGQRSVSEPLMPGVEITLINVSTNFVEQITISDGSGRYCFSNLAPNIAYQVVFSINSGSTYTSQHLGATATDSDASLSDGSTAAITPTDNETIDNIDAGLCIPPLIGNFVWKDNDKDGIQDIGEPGIPGVKIDLYDASNTIVGSAITDNAGYYEFGGYNNLNILPDTTYVTVVLTETSKIINCNNDAEQIYNASDLTTGAVELGSDDLELGLESADMKIKIVGLRFTTINIPQGATITNSYIQFSEDDGGAEGNATTYTIFGEDVDDAAAFDATIPGDISLRSSTANRTTSQQVWSPGPWGMVNARTTLHQTTDIKTIIQEIVNRTNWTSGNDLVIMLTGTEEREAESCNGNRDHAPEIVITYEDIIYYLTDNSLQAVTAYELRLDTAQAAISPCILTQTNANSITTNDPLVDDEDSDASVIGTTAIISLTSPAVGKDNKGYDYGFRSEVINKLTVTLIPDSTICQGEMITLYGILDTNESPNYQWQNSPTSCTTGFININGATDSTYVVTPTDTTYYRLITSVGDCVDTSGCVSIYTTDGPQVTVADVLKCTTNSETISVSPSGGTTSYSYNWSGPFIADPGNVDNFRTSIPGTYTVTVTDAEGCTTAASGELTFQSKVCLPATFTIRRGQRN